MFYRYEIQTAPDEPWQGSFQFFYPDQCRHVGQWLKEPAWYRKHPETDSRCWFTQYGFDKFKDIVEELIQSRLESNPDWEMRLLQAETLENVAMKGKVQWIQLV